MESVSWSTIGVAIGLIGLSLTFAGFWMKVQAQITSSNATAEAAKASAASAKDTAKDAAAAAMEEAKSAGLRAVQANLKIDDLQSKLSDFQRYAEREFANHEDLKQLANHNDSQFSDMKNDLRGITQRLDKLLERGFPPVNA
jgi:chromosome segregation ATPase